MEATEFIRVEERSGGHMVQIHCEASCTILVNVHALRAASKPFKELLDRVKPDLDIDLDVLPKGFKIFADWLKEGGVPLSAATDFEIVQDLTVGRDLKIVQDLCSAYQVGRQFKVSPHFLDEVMDKIVHAVLHSWVPKNHGRHRDGQDTSAIAKQLRTTFEQGSVGRTFLVDWLVHGDLTDVGKEPIWGETLALEAAKEAELHRKVCMGMFREKLCKTSVPPWSEDGNECDYHAHVASDLACYSKQSYFPLD
ncbi:hypothetical protein LTR10_004268 [Elasticomyces elasticus]|nr:hypothetical protein LTR10_004268 [Elasticomyces elasticus]KAK4977552.1 hypothetical protein LTR42_001922 [Elasticomyces elasticus]